jgi:curved DNA-binding protein CbpA
MQLEEALNILDLSFESLEINSLKKAYQQKAKETHPDKGGKAEDFIIVRNAYTFLRDYLLKGKTTHTNYQSENTKTESEQENQDFWKIKYQETYYEKEKFFSENNYLWKTVKSYESQINRIVIIFNTGQKLLSKAQENIQNILAKIDEIYNQELEKIKKKYNSSWSDLILSRKKLSKYEFVMSQNNLVQQINRLEQEELKKYNDKIKEIYSQIMNQIHNTLSE